MYAEKRFDEVVAPHKPEPSLDGFIGWLRTKPPRGKYDFNDCEGRCLLGQYMAFCGIKWTVKGAELEAYAHMVVKVFPRGDSDVLVGRRAIGTNGEWTYGAALKRAQVYQRRYMRE